jgi:hypothetical protein
MSAAVPYVRARRGPGGKTSCRAPKIASVSASPASTASHDRSLRALSQFTVNPSALYCIVSYRNLSL